MLQLDTENADLNLTSLVTVLTHTPDASNPRLCMGYVKLGDGSKNLSGAGGNFEVTVTVGGQTCQAASQVVVFTTAVRSSFFTAPFPVPANEEVLIRVKSPNGADTDVDTTAYLYDVENFAIVAQVAAIHGKLPSKAYLTGTDNSDGDVEFDDATGNYPGSVGSVAGNVGGTVASVVGNVDGSVGSVVGNVGGDVTGNVSGNVSGAVGSVAGDVAGKVLGGGVGEIVGYGVNANVSTTDIANDVFEHPIGDHTNAGTFGGLFNTQATNVSAIKAKTDNLPSDPADQSAVEAAITAIPAAPTAASIADAVCDEALSGHATPGSLGAALSDLLSRLGAFTGTGVNTVLGALKALMNKTASAPSDIGGTFDPATDSTEALRDSAISASDVLTQVNAALDASVAELTGPPAATASLRQAAKLVQMWLQHNSSASNTQRKLRNAAGTVIAQGTITSTSGVTEQGALTAP